MLKQALGFIETYGYISAVEAADSCLKAANVQLINSHFVGKGLVTIIIQGDVGAVKAAIDAGSTAAARVGEVVSINVIARPGIGLEKVVEDKTYYLSQEDRFISKQKIDIETKEEIEKVEENKPSKEIYVYHKGKKILFNDIEIFKSMKVVELRKIARQVKRINITKEEIKFAKKEELLNALRQALTEVD
ncbi:BMC domain-containing protein [Clostridiaceae bacterium M8S5]|nr:BMC domain-containing protein [Clostridiaceae bacterium M8S5]